MVVSSLSGHWTVLVGSQLGVEKEEVGEDKFLGKEQTKKMSDQAGNSLAEKEHVVGAVVVVAQPVK